MSLFGELKRRNVFRVGIAYVVVAWLALQVADVILNNIEAPGWVFETILLVLLIGLPVVLLFAWAFELTPEGIKREKDVDRTQSITPRTGKKLDRVIIAVMAVALAYFAIDKFLPEHASAPSAKTSETATTPPEPEPAAEKSIAVLPLANRSNREEDQFFTDGMHDDLLTQLAKISSLKVISRTSVMRYRDTELPIPEIARQLGVSTVLEGGIQRAGDQVRINVQLIDAATDEHLWAETYDRQLTAENLFAIQSEITREIIAALKGTLTPDENARISERPTDNLAALEEYMKGQQELAGRTVAGIQEGQAHFDRALELDPGFTLASVGKANALHLLFEYAGLPETETLDPAMDLLAQALEKSPNLGDAYLVRGEIHRHRDEYAAAEQDFLRARQLLPGDATVYHWFSFLRGDQGRDDEYYELLERAHQLNPMSAVIHANWAMRPFFEGDGEESLRELQRIKSLHPAYPFTYSLESWIYYNRGDPVSSLRAQLKILELDPASTRAGFQCLTYLYLRALEAARKCVRDYDGPRQGRRLWAELELLMSEGNSDAIRALIAEFETDEEQQEFVAFASLIVGDFEQARTLYQGWRADWFDDEATIDQLADEEDRGDAIAVAYLMQRTGDSARAEQLLMAALDGLEGKQRDRGAEAYGFADASIYALLGRREDSLKALEEAAELPYLSDWNVLDSLPWFESLHGDPRFDSVLKRLAMAAENARKQALAEGLL